VREDLPPVAERCRRQPLDVLLPRLPYRSGPGSAPPPPMPARYYCSYACSGLARRRRVSLMCRRCGAEFSVIPSDARRRRYCSRACFYAPRRLVTCGRTGCRKQFSVYPSVLAQGAGKFCSRRCVRLAHAPRSFRCRSCKAGFKAPAWRAPRFCSLSCSNRGRERPPDPVLVARNERILELHARRLKSPKIQEELARENPAWWASTALIRKVISPGTNGSRANIHTLPAPARAPL
jgi:hypothetical protein